MKKLAAVISTTLLVASASANAQFYLGAKAGVTWLDDFCTTGACDEDSWALGSFLGYEITDAVAIEAGLDALGETTGAGYKDAGMSAYTLAPRFSFALNEDLDLFAKIGGAHVKYGNDEDGALLGAIGLNYSIIPSIDIQAELQHFNGISIETTSFDANTFTLGFRSKFGGSSEPTPEPVEEVLVEETVVEEVVVVTPVVKTFETKVVDSGSFELNSSELKPASKQKLEELVVFMNEYPQANVEVVGYTDTSGAASYNQKLSEKRAQSVANALEAEGIDASRITVSGQGESNPIASNDTHEGRVQNRRVEITVPAFEYEEK
ncbi:OmpA family protein [Vibrio atypicus]|uniref:OmpA family protein n=1 Tax=Vibrio atypicus TaxID=558271 RepID=UPI00135C8B34|nr:OmpA family protein [Vibrio atypicus]